MKAIDRIYKYLEDNNLSAYQFEKKIKVSNGYLAKALEKQSSLGEDILLRISQTFDLSLKWLVTGEDDIKTVHEDQDNLMGTKKEPNDGLLEILANANADSAAAARHTAAANERLVYMLEKEKQNTSNTTADVDHLKIQDLETTLAALWGVFAEELAQLTGRKVDSVYRSVGIKAAALAKKRTSVPDSIQNS